MLKLSMMYRNFFKRIFDFILSLFALILLSPVFIVLMIIGRIKMKGDPFFYQERPGKNEKIFKLIKFRSMTEEKDENGNYLPDEVRLTKYGKWLRESSLDEIPELINIIKGDMAIVGPRPLLVQYLPLYNEEQKHRHDVRPGLTGLAQINGRFNILWKDKLAYDSQYAKNVTLLGDIDIILKTVGLVFKHDDVENEDMGSWYPFLGNDVEDQQITLLKQKHKEIGSTFFDVELTDKDNKLFNDKTKWFISGRAALDFIIKDIKVNNPKVKSALLPSWCCESMIEPFINNGIKVKFYPVVIEKNKLVRKITSKADIILNMNYFGYESETIKFNGIIINDLTHSIFNSKSLKGDYAFGSLRKWSGIITGGFAYAKKQFSIEQETITNNEYIELKKDAFDKKKKYINGEAFKKEYMETYKEAEDMLDNDYSSQAYEQDIYNAKHLDVNSIKKARQNNAKELLKVVKDYAIFKTIKKNDCPLFVPIIVPNGRRDELKQVLIDNRIYCPIHWPISNMHALNKKEEYIYNNELSLVCDQRYNLDDMKKIRELLKEFFKED